MTKPQILFIGGGMTFKNYDDYLDYLRNYEISFDHESVWLEVVDEADKFVDMRKEAVKRANSLNNLEN